MSAHVLIVDDDPVQRRLLQAAVEKLDHNPILANGGIAALEHLRAMDPKIDVVILDLAMPDLSGQDVLVAMREMGLETPVIVQTGQGGIETVVNAMRAGAFDFVVKPVSPERLEGSLDGALKIAETIAKPRRMEKRNASNPDQEAVLSASPAMNRVLELARKASMSTIPVVLEGESGVGKELIARAIQRGSDRANKPFVVVNCGAIPENLIESILFGHEKGAFTGATERHTGKFVEANHGTLFLDEIGDLSLEAQVKLLRAVQQGEIETVGARRSEKVDVRLISATHKNLVEEVKAGRFREDLYYRLNVFPIAIPALRRRKEDIPLLARKFADRFARENGVPTPMVVDSEAMALLTAYDWPGNIRQLENAVFRAVILSNSGELSPDAFPQIAAQLTGYDVHSAGQFPRVEATGDDTMPAPIRSVIDPLVMPRMDDEPLVQIGQQIFAIDADGEVRPLEAVEEEHIRIALDHYKGRMSEVARRLQIGRSTLYRKLKDYDIDPLDPKYVSETTDQ